MRLYAHNNTTKDYRRARNLRNNASPIEEKLWRVLREAAKAEGLKFRRQQAVHPYIADFACMEARLLIELDGDTHANKKGYDLARDKKLRDMGFVVLRYTNDDVVQNVDGVAMKIIHQAAGLTQNTKSEFLLNSPLPNPPREGEGISTCPNTFSCQKEEQ
jgi:very-short-patch-repair endonuclease